MKRIAIVGGGISGLTAAYVLHRDHAATCSFTLFEASNRFGGIVETIPQDGFIIECGPDSWVTDKPWAEQLARELGLSDDLLPSNDATRRTYLAQGDTLTALPDAMRMMVPFDLEPTLASPLFSDTAKEAYRTEPERAVQLRDTALLRHGLEADESVAAFVERHFGREVTETVAGSLLAGVFGGDIHALSARALLGPFVAMEAERGSLITALQQHRNAKSRSVFTTLASGLGTLIERLLHMLPFNSLRKEIEVRALQSVQSSWLVSTSAGTELFDAVLLATSLDSTQRLLGSLSIAGAQETAQLLPAEASSSLIVALGYQPEAAKQLHIPRGFGLLVAPAASAQSSSLLACTFLDQKFPRRAPRGAVLLRAFFGSAAADTLSCRSDEAIAAAAHEQLSRLLGPLPRRADITIVRRWPRSLPQYAVGHLLRMTQFDQWIDAIPTLAVSGNAYRGVGLPDLVRDAATAAKKLAAV